MLKDCEPTFIVDKFTKYGKWMDGWETRRKRIPGHDWSIVALCGVSLIKGITVDTAFFTGNYAPRISIQAANLDESSKLMFPGRVERMGTESSEAEFMKIETLQTDKWEEIVPMTKLQPGYEDTRRNYFKIDSKASYTHLRVNMYPDGGIARFRVYGDVQPNLEAFMNNNVEDLVAFNNGGKCISYSNAHFGHPRNIIKIGKGINMGDGWETARRLDRPPILKTDEYGILQVPGNEWAVFKLCCRGNIEKLVVDTNHFKGNYPDNVKIEGADIPNFNDELECKSIVNASKWIPIIKQQKLGPHREHEYSYKNFIETGPFTHIRVTMAPDGGISRLRVLGRSEDIF